jgi:Flp pilus assembly secretin CpaC
MNVALSQEAVPVPRPVTAPVAPVPTAPPCAVTPVTLPAPAGASGVYKLRNAAAADVAAALDTFFGREKRAVTVVAEPVSNTLLVSAGHEQLKDVIKILDRLDQAPPQVRVELMVLQVPADFTEKLGLRKPGEFGTKPWELSDHEHAMFYALLRQAKQDGMLEILSRPQIQVMDNQTGFVQVGSQHPCPIAAADGKAAQVEMIPVGLSARVTPRVSPDGKVLLRVEMTYTSATPQPVNLGNGVMKTPAFNVELIEQCVSLADGGTAVICGGTQTREVRQQFGPPVISNIPYINRLYTNVGISTERTEHLLVVTAHVVKPTAGTPPVAVPPPAPVVRAMPYAVPLAAPAALARPAVVARPFVAPALTPPSAPRPAVPACCEAACGSCDKAKAAELVKAYHTACAAGDKDAATRCAVQALALDPTCFAPSK